MGETDGAARPVLTGREAGERLAAQLPEILARWEQRVAGTAPGLRENPEPVLRSTLPAFLERLARALAEEPEEEPEERKLAPLRAEPPAYTLDQVICEYQYARAAVLEALEDAESGAGLHSPIRICIDAAFDQAVRSAAAEYVEATQEVLREAERDYQILTESTREYAILTLDQEGIIRSWSPGAEQVTGWSAEETIGRHFALLFTPEDRERGVPEGEKREAETTGRANDERWQIRKDGSLYFAQGALLPLRNGHLRGYAKVFRDATRRKCAEDERDRLYRLEQEARARAEATAERLRRLQTVTDVALLGHLPLENLLQELLTRIREALKVDAAAVLLSEDGVLVVRAADGVMGEVVARLRVPFGQGFSGRIAAERRPLTVADVREFPMHSPLIQESGIRSLLGVPMLAGEEVLGVLHVGCRTPGDFDEEAVRLLELVAERAAVAIERARLYEELRARSERLQLLAETADELMLREQPEQFLSTVYERLAAHLDLEVYINYRVNETGTGLRLVSCTGVPESALPAIQELEFGQAVCGTAAAERTPIVVEDLQAREGVLVEMIRTLGLTAYACHPLIAGDELIGTLSFGTRRRKTFQPEELALMRAVSDQTAVALERARLLRQLQQRAEALAEADRRKNEFLAMLAHELRNPLAGIANATHLLDEIVLEDPSRPRLRGVIRRQTEHLSRMVDDLMDVARIMQQKITLRKQVVDLTTVVHQAVEVVRPLVETRRHTLSVYTPPEPVWVHGDPTRLEQIVTNLLNNAAKYTEPGGRISVEVERREGVSEVERREERGEREGSASTLSPLSSPLSPTPSTALIRVRDTGIGIPDTLLPHIFDLFTQAETLPEEPGEGLGIGLTLVKQLVELHGGRIEAVSEGPGKGSEFTVRLPVAQDEGGRRKDEGSGLQGLHPSSLIPPPSRRRVLLVEDNPDAAETLEEILRMWGTEVRLARTGAEALEIAAQFEPEAAILDIGLPGMDGYEVARRLRGMAEAADLLLIALTGYGQAEDRARSREAGFDVHLTKPVDPDALRRLLAAGPV